MRSMKLQSCRCSAPTRKACSETLNPNPKTRNPKPETLNQVLSAKSQGVFLPEQLVVRSCSYIMSAVTLAITWQQLKQNVMPLVTHVIFPVLCFESRDRALWEEVSMLLTKPLYAAN